ncbi:MAG TPA: hypothetical protein DCZ01_05675 [Elusimicrobia bacterium]|nr:hypothetical protein [Elusimicrobiota bacterium]
MLCGAILSLVLILEGSLSPSQAAGSDERGQTAARLSALYQSLPAPEGNAKTENTDYMLLDSLSAVYLSYDAKRLPGPKDWLTSRGTRVPVDALMASVAAISDAYREFGVDEAFAYEFAFRVQKEIVEALPADWEDYQKFFLPLLEKSGLHFPDGRILSDQRLLEGLRQVQQIVELYQEYDIPYLAGYSQENPKRIYIDRGLIAQSAAPFLIIHEVTEKLLIDALGPQDQLYVHTHQYAQRLERECVIASGLPWRQYQDVDMQREIKRAEDPQRVYKQTPADLDLTPYLEYKDVETLAKLRASAKAVPQGKQPGMKLGMIRPGILHVYFDSGLEMAKTLLRFQEFYESPEFRGKYFTLEQFINWHTEKNGKFDYYQAWGGEAGNGFNLPSRVLEPFFAGQFDPLSPREAGFLELFRHRRHADFYVIVTASNSGEEIKHEMAHALFHSVPGYKKEVLAILKAYRTGALERFLVEKYGYNVSVASDEAHAWIMTDTETLRKDGFDLRPLSKAADELKVVYGRYFQSFDTPIVTRDP